MLMPYIYPPTHPHTRTTHTHAHQKVAAAKVAAPSIMWPSTGQLRAETANACTHCMQIHLSRVSYTRCTFLLFLRSSCKHITHALYALRSRSHELNPPRAPAHPSSFLPARFLTAWLPTDAHLRCLRCSRRDSEVKEHRQVWQKKKNPRTGGGRGGGSNGDRRNGSWTLKVTRRRNDQAILNPAMHTTYESYNDVAAIASNL